MNSPEMTEENHEKQEEWSTKSNLVTYKMQSRSGIHFTMTFSLVNSEVLTVTQFVSTED
jgi:hypothetical protein